VGRRRVAGVDRRPATKGASSPRWAGRRLLRHETRQLLDAASGRPLDDAHRTTVALMVLDDLLSVTISAAFGRPC
jgi:hypothetical protein